MQTNFKPVQLSGNPEMAASEAVIRKCVHCGFCIATCPTYVLLGNELDSPRGRIYLMKNMLETQSLPSATDVKHIDRCLSCLSCMTTCPSGVNYMHLVDHARAYIEEHHRRPLADRLLRNVLAFVLPHPARFRLALILAQPFRGLAPVLREFLPLKPVAAMLALAPRRLSPALPVQTMPAAAPRKGRIVLAQGCVESILQPSIRAAAVRLLNRVGYDVAFAPGEGCCGALTHHMGRKDATFEMARRNVESWIREIDGEGVDAIVITASGCGTTIKDYGFLLRDDPHYAGPAARVSALVKDISELLDLSAMPFGRGNGITVAYHAACSIQHGQKITKAPIRLLTAAGFTVETPAESHLCCGSAGVYNILQPDIARQLGERKAKNLESLHADVIVSGNIGCAVQIGAHTNIPMVHIAELLDWATGGPLPSALAASKCFFF